MRYIARAFKILKQRGPGYLVYLLNGYFVPNVTSRLLSRFPRLKRLGSLSSVSQRRQRAKALPSSGNAKFTSWATYPIDEATRERIEVARSESPNTEIVIGRLDKDGRVVDLWGRLPNLVNIPEDHFVKRTRYSLDIVLVDDCVLIRKDFRGDRFALISASYL